MSLHEALRWPHNFEVILVWKHSVGSQMPNFCHPSSPICFFSVPTEVFVTPGHIGFVDNFT